MLEPITATTAGASMSTTSSAAASVGIMALFIGWFGQVGADVTMVIISALAGCFIGNSEEKKTFIDGLKFIAVMVLVSLALAWGLAGFVAEKVPSLQGVYLPSTIAFVIGLIGKRLPKIFHASINKAEEKIGIKEDGK